MADKKQDLQDVPRYWVRITLTSAATLRITTRKTPCGEGSKTWDRYQMRIHKRILDLFSNSETVSQLTLYDLDPMVHAEVKIEGGAA
uniref:Ribosomal_S10 domain-containing protein n=1 Tax=Mesocestoides corti TaxID=53468 RepID=A0A5K3EI08_MESCO